MRTNVFCEEATEDKVEEYYNKFKTTGEVPSQI